MENQKYYGQFQTDKHISEFFPKGYIGNCMEIGACDGVFVSNTLIFEQQGWNCICVEPNKEYYKSLSKNRKCTVNCACGLENKNDVDFTIFDLHGGNQSAISSLKIDERLVDSHTHLISNSFTEKVNIRTIDEILKQFPLIISLDFLSIDTEGTELDVLQGFDIDKWKPKLFVIENNFNDPQITEYLSVFGYKKVKRIEVNDFYIPN